MNKFVICGLLTFYVVSAQINVQEDDAGGAGDAVEGGEEVNTKIFGDIGNQFLLTTGAVITGNLATGALGLGFDAYRDKCRFRRRKRQAEDGKEEVDTRLICLNALLPANCDVCRCYESACRRCARCRNDYYDQPYRPSRPSRPSHVSSGWSSWSSWSSYKPSYVYRNGLRFRVAEDGQEIEDPEPIGTGDSLGGSDGEVNFQQ